MTNPFSGILTAEHKTLFNNAIDAVLECCSKPCELVYKGSKFEECPNCYWNPSTQKSSNKYKTGGPVPFNTGRCPYCSGRGRLVSSTTESVDLCVLFDSRQWVRTTVADRILARGLQTPESFAQTLCNITLLPKLKKAAEIIMDTDIEGYVVYQYIREGEPEPCGLGTNNFIATMWKRAG